VDRKLMDRVVDHFRTIHKRDPTEQEQANLWKFLTTGGLPICESENAGVENQNQNIKKVNFDSDEDDSEYVPEEQEVERDSQDSEEIVHLVD